jgi:putative glutamine amidotransferase
MKRAPRIGFSLDYETKGGYSRMPWYALRENYMTAVSSLGAVALPLPHDVAHVEDYLGLIDGLVITGGAFDIPPSFYGESDVHPTVELKEQRTAFEFAITRAAVERDIPVLGICGGQQLLNVVLGGSLIQHIPDAVPNALAHEQPNPRTEPGHTVSIAKDSLLHRIVGKTEISVNSAHHQAVKKAAPGAIVNALAPDGVIEGIELPGKRFCLGVQWHPEYHVTSADSRIFEAFVEACRHKK